MSVSFAVVLSVTVLSVTGAAVSIAAIRGWVETIRIRQGKETTNIR